MNSKRLVTFALLLFCLSGFGQAILRNNLDTNNVAPAGGNGYLLESVGGVPVWTATITAQVENWWDACTNIDTNIWPIAVLTWGYDGNRWTGGDGATKGGIPFGVRYWPSDTNALTQGPREGELAVTQIGLGNSPVGQTNPVLWINGDIGSNWTPAIQIAPANGTRPQNLLGTGVPYIVLQTANTNPATAGSTSGTAGTLQSPGALTIGPGAPGAATVSGGTTGNGGAAGLISDLGGNGGGVITTTGGTGGNGGAGGFGRFNGGNGGNASHAHIAGNGGSGGTWSIIGGNGSADTVAGNGFNGGNGGTLTAKGANGSTTIAGGNGGSFLADGLGGSANAGTVNVEGVASKNEGANETGIGSTYMPMTIFTTSSTTGLVSTTSASLIGAVQSLAGVSSLTVNGANIPSNIVSHVGRTLRITAWGYLATNGTPTLQIQVKLGGTAVVDTGTVTISSITATQSWKFTADIPFRTTGGSGTVLGQGKLEYGTSSSQTEAVVWALATATTTISTIVDEPIDLVATMSTGSGNVFVSTGVTAELLN